METFVGDTVKLILKTGINISIYTTFLMMYEKPDGTKGFWNADISVTDTTWLEYDTLTTDLDQHGTWKLQAHVEALGVQLHGKLVDLIVLTPIFQTEAPTTAGVTTLAP